MPAPDAETVRMHGLSPAEEQILQHVAELQDMQALEFAARALRSNAMPSAHGN
eukprot:COSAG06_NODE_64262_length_260_cov_0.614907_1_plen_52_part_01